jgi:predicted naringenin-chalcone synthase
MTRPTLRAIGTALPGLGYDQLELARLQAAAWGLSGVELSRWDRIVRGSGILRRHAVAPIEQVIRLSTAERMRLYERHAGPLAAEAARTALREAATDADAVTDLIVVTCTGFAAPGVGPELVGRLGLRPSVRHALVGFMGCFGGVVGLRSAAGAAALAPDAVVLLVCVELCSLHLRDERSPEQLVASALFADGAAAAVLTQGGQGREVGPGRSRLLEGTAGAMSWRIEDDGFRMTLGREVPERIEAAVGPFLAGAPPRAVAVHPGGAGVLDAIERGTATIPLDDRSLRAARGVLADCGNMSSGSVLFVLDRLLRAEVSGPIDAIAFGPGLTIDAVRVG